MKRMLVNRPWYIWRLPLIYKVLGKHKFTMVSAAALLQAYQTVLDLDHAHIEGDIVEMGCWRGGCAAVMGYATHKNVSDRTVHAFDSFEGLPPAAQTDVRIQEKYGKKSEGHLKDASPEDVNKAFRAVGLKNPNLRVYKGWFRDTIPTIQTDKIALLRLDGDLYSSTMDSLEGLYDKVVPGGIVIVDDYNDFRGCRQAVHEFLYKRGLFPKIMDYPYGGEKYFRKKVL